MTKFLKVIQLDASDNHVYENAAEHGEWAIPGTFYFWDIDPNTLEGKTKQAFAHGFLGLNSFGWASVVTISAISAEDLDALTQRLAAHLVERFGAPDIAAALPAAREEVAFAVSLCDQEPDTLITLQRDYYDDEITENFKRMQRPAGAAHLGLKMFGVDTV